MKRAAFEYNVRLLLGRRPFRPFDVELSSGKRLSVNHPEVFAFRAGSYAVIDRQGRFSIFDEETVARITNESKEAARS